MTSLIIRIDNLRKKYRRVFIKIGELFCKKEAFMSKAEFLAYLNKKLARDISKKKQEIFVCQNDFNCLGCGACCKLACSEFSHPELCEKAKQGDNFAKQFVSVFVPYGNVDEAKKIYPEYFEMLSAQGECEQTYFYHCPKVSSDNRCPDYENRPQICRDFPDNPLGLLPKNCGYSDWSKKIETKALILRAASEIIEFYKQKFNVNKY